MMYTQENKKICWNCEGEVLLHQNHCPYCGVGLRQTSFTETAFSKELQPNLSLEDSLAPLYKPPYALGCNDRRDEEKKQMPQARQPQIEEEVQEEVKNNKELWALFLLSTGGYLVTLGLLIFFFSDGGVLTLKWKSKFWFIYCFLSVPFLSIGWRYLKRVKKTT